jgi:hypothetical protein
VANPSKSSKDSSESVSSHLHLKDSCSHVISEIHPTRFQSIKVVAQDKSKKDQKKATVKRGKPPLIENMGFNVLMLFFLRTDFIGMMTNVLDNKDTFRQNVLDNMDMILFLGNSHVLF